MANILNLFNTNNYFVLLTFLTWTLIWKGLALWKSARLKHTFWFIVLLIFNTVGLLEIFYIFVLSKLNYDKLMVKLTPLKNLIRRKK